MRLLAASFVVGLGCNTCWQSARPAARRDAACYQSIEQPLHFRNPQRTRQAFSQRYAAYQLGEVIPITADTALFRFLLHDADDEFNLRPCSTLQACYKYGVQPTDQCHRFYTPVTPNHTRGYFDIIVKRKAKGKMTSHLFGMNIGDSLLFRSVAFKIQYKPNRWQHVGMIAGGTGFTPMLQIVRYALTDPASSANAEEERRAKDATTPRTAADTTRFSLLLCNRTERHILLRGVFDQLARDFASRFRVFYAVDMAIDRQRWLREKNHYVGYVTREMLQASMPAPQEPKKIILLCGPDALLHHVAGTPMSVMATMSGSYAVQPLAADSNNLTTLGGLLAELGYSNDDVYRF